MPPEESLQLPFLTRLMLGFEHGTAFALELVTYTSSTQEIQIIGFTREGPFTFSKQHDGDGAEEVDSFRIPDFPISVTIFTESVLLERGELFVTLYLTMNGTRVSKLCSGYVSKQSGPSWPITQSESELAGPGNFIVALSTNPAAGAEITLSPGVNEHWIVHALSATLVTDANAADRRPHFGFNFDGVTGPIQFWAGTNQTASQTLLYSVAPVGVVAQSIEDNDVLISIPANIHLNPGSSIVTVTTNLQAGDNWSAMRAVVERFFED